jgi:hypothetical protein
MSFLRHSDLSSGGGFEAGLGAKQVPPPPPSHRLDESQPVIPWQVALLQGLPPLHQPVSSSLQSAATVNFHRLRVVEFSIGRMRNFQSVLTLPSIHLMGRQSGAPAIGTAMRE